MLDYIINFGEQSGFYQFFTVGQGWKNLIMIAIACLLCWLAIHKKFEPLLLLPIAIGMLLTNLPGAGVYNEALFAGGHVHWDLFGGEPITQELIDTLINVDKVDPSSAVITYLQSNVGNTITPGLIDVLYLGVKLGI